jgi:DNA repair exonuclease SbcCD ATPase subunit
MKILKFRGENVKRLKFVEIEPGEGAVVLKGKNEQGKSSVLDAIWYALGGTTQIKGQPLREGEEKGYSEVDLGSFVVRRTFTPNGTNLSVKDQYGAKPSSPQQLLDSLMGKLSDPHALARMKPADQRAVFIDLLGVGDKLAKVDQQIAEVTEERKMVNKSISNAKGEYNSLPEPEGEVPSELVSVSDLMEELSQAEAQARANNEWIFTLDNRESLVASIKEEIEELKQKYKEKVKQFKEATASVKEAQAKVDSLEAPDLEGIRSRIASADSINEKVRQAEARNKALEALNSAKETYSILGEKKASLEAEKVAILSNAKMPIEGLGIDADGITFNGLPIDNASDAQRTLIYASIAMAMNPEIKILKISDGSLLDDEHMDRLVQMANEKGFQLWIEAVSDSPEGASVYIEDGQVLNSEEPEDN